MIRGMSGLKCHLRDNPAQNRDGWQVCEVNAEFALITDIFILFSIAMYMYSCLAVTLWYVSSTAPLTGFS